MPLSCSFPLFIYLFSYLLLTSSSFSFFYSRTRHVCCGLSLLFVFWFVYSLKCNKKQAKGKKTERSILLGKHFFRFFIRQHLPQIQHRKKTSLKEESIYTGLFFFSWPGHQPLGEVTCTFVCENEREVTESPPLLMAHISYFFLQLPLDLFIEGWSVWVPRDRNKRGKIDDEKKKTQIIAEKYKKRGKKSLVKTLLHSPKQHSFSFHSQNNLTGRRV